MQSIIFYIFILILLEGCTTKTPPIQEYTLSPLSSIQTSIQINKTLRLSTTKSPPSLMTKNILYVKANNESGSYLYSRWSDIPPIMIERSIVDALSQNAFKSVIPTTSMANSDWILESDLRTFHHYFDEIHQSYGIIDITFHLINTKTKETVSSKRFYFKIPAEHGDAKGGVKALEQGVKLLTEHLLQWITINLSERK